MAAEIGSTVSFARPGWRGPVVGVLVLALALMSNALGTLGPAEATQPAARVAVNSVDQRSSGSCVDVLILGVGGNGKSATASDESVVSVVTGRIANLARVQGRTTVIENLDGRAPAPWRLLRHQSRKATITELSAGGTRVWRSPISSLTSRLKNRLVRRAAACPNQPIVLVGRGQGAAAVHRVAAWAAARDTRPQLAGVVAVSDPLRKQNSVAGRAWGRPAAALNTPGLIAMRDPNRADLPRSTAASRVIQVCTRGDVVCDPRTGTAARGLATARYADQTARALLEQAGDGVWARLQLHPVPKSRTATVAAGVPFGVKLGVLGGSGVGAPATWAGRDLPTGVTLSPTGLLSGQIEEPGTLEVRYTVAGRDPQTGPVPGTAVLHVVGEAGTVSAGAQTSCEVALSGRATCWGRNDFGQIGNGTRINQAIPVRVPGGPWANVSAGGSHTCGVKRDGTLWCWGLNNYRQLGGADRNLSATPRQVGRSTKWREVRVGESHSCATRTNGTLWCWGENLHGQLGRGDKSRAKGVGAVVGTQQWQSIDVGAWHTCAVDVQGRAWCWGENDGGQLGDGTYTTRTTPVRVKGGGRYLEVAAGWLSSCGVTRDSLVRCWGQNERGALGNGTATPSATPVSVGLPLGGWTSVTVGLSHACASGVAGETRCWGDNRYGQLGSGTTAEQSLTPVRVAATTERGLLSAGWFHTCTVATCWGADDLGQLGDGAATAVQMPAKKDPVYWGAGHKLTKQQVRNLSASKIAAKVLVDKPAVTNAQRTNSAATSVKVLTFNVLGSNHTSPSGGRSNFAHARVRAEWAAQLIRERDVSLVGLSEPQPDQIIWLNQALRNGWTIYPGNTMGYSAAPQSLMWRDSEWKLVWGTTPTMPFMRGVRPQSLVLLQNRRTGRRVYMLNAHLSPGKMQDDRDKGMAIMSALVKQLSKDGLPILVTGDLNEHEKAFQRIACPNDMVTALGGKTAGKTCTPPRPMRVDWVMGKFGTFSGGLFEGGPKVWRTTDHAIVSGRFTLR